MTKPLELTVYERDEYGDYVDVPADNGKQYLIALEDVEVYAMTKRFTDAELAAEYHQADMQFHRKIWEEMSRGEDWPDETWNRIAKPVNTLHRFATLPHYDEPTP